MARCQGCVGNATCSRQQSGNTRCDPTHEFRKHTLVARFYFPTVYELMGSGVSGDTFGRTSAEQTNKVEATLKKRESTHLGASGKHSVPTRPSTPHLLGRLRTMRAWATATSVLSLLESPRRKAVRFAPIDHKSTCLKAARDRSWAMDRFAGLGLEHRRRKNASSASQTTLGRGPFFSRCRCFPPDSPPQVFELVTP